MKRLHTIAIVALVGLAGCALEDGAYYDPPDGRAVTQVSLAPETGPDDIAERLATLGFRITSQGAGFVEGRASNTDLIDCGTITQVVFDNRARFPGSAPSSVIYTDFENLDLLTRSLSVSSRVRVDLEDGTAMIDERHRVTVSWRAGSGRSLGRQTRTVSSGQTASFSDGTSCAVGSSIAAALH